MTSHGHRIPVHVAGKQHMESHNVTQAERETMENGEAGRPAPQPESAESRELEQVREQWMRTAADLDNMRKRMARQIETETKRERERVLESFLPVVDNLERALTSGEDEEENPWIEGMQVIRNQMLDILKSFGVIPFESSGEAFDPDHHDAVAHLPGNGAVPGTVLEETQKGYRREDASVLRHAKVVVAC